MAELMVKESEVVGLQAACPGYFAHDQDEVEVCQCGLSPRHVFLILARTALPLRGITSVNR